MNKTSKVTPYNSSKTKKQQVTKMFDGIAPYYDLLNRILSLGIDTIWRKKAISRLKDNNPKTLLDIATGTGDLALEANKQLNLESIIGLDISSEMIVLAKKKVSKRNAEDIISMMQGDSEDLPFNDNNFDAITAAFGVRNFGDLRKGLSEMYRVLNTNGKIVILEFSRPTIFPFKQLFNGYFKYILPTIGRIKSKDPKAYQYLYESVQVFPDFENFDTILKETGFKNTSWSALSLGICTIYEGYK